MAGERSCAFAPWLVSVSGGLDSVALLLLLDRIARRWPRWQLEVVHFNHGLRPEAVAEEIFVNELASLRGRRCHVRRADDPKKFKEAANGGLQAAAREWRRRESQQLLEESGLPSGSTVLAHHLDDQVETQLLKLIRGGHLARLGGMQPEAGLFVRPLLGITKSRLRAFLEAEGQHWFEDASNARPDYQRNKVRLQLVPLLAELMGGEDAVRQRFDAIGDQSRQLADLLGEACALNGCQDFPLPVEEAPACVLSTGEEFQRLPEMVRHETLWRFVSNACGVMLSYLSVCSVVRALGTEGARSGSPWSLSLGNGWQMERKTGSLVLVRAASAIAWDTRSLGCRRYNSHEQTWMAQDLCVRHAVFGGTAASSSSLELRVERGGAGAAAAGETLSSDFTDWHHLILHHVPLGSKLILRGAARGDRFCPGGSGKAINYRLTQFLGKSLQLPPCDRPNWPVVTVCPPCQQDEQIEADEGYGQEVVAAIFPDKVAGDFSLAAASDVVQPVHIWLRWDTAPQNQQLVI
ncbi:unnamed protein product [Polarella glacialis]|uniref:tRNA(Ile)-lysidine synthetase n=1 Tax=Polarella glacialis TaxID=89957 RepID=A0A813HX65_POLGL|nr:unnamed protein product [Polarella glacialis]